MVRLRSINVCSKAFRIDLQLPTNVAQSEWEQNKNTSENWQVFEWMYSSVVELPAHNGSAAGSIPVASTIKVHTSA